MKQGVSTGVVGIGLLLSVRCLMGCGEETQVAAANGPPAMPLQTGQTTCYDVSGSTIPCAGTGQDGATQTGAPRRYVDNGDGTITDVSTGLIWEKKSNDGSLHDQSNAYTWGDAFGVFIAGLNNARFAGHSDWRLPNQFELHSLVDLGQNGPAINPVFNAGCTAACTVTTCSCTQSDYYSSATAYARVPFFAWGVDFSDGNVNGHYKTLSYYVRAVRGGL